MNNRIGIFYKVFFIAVLIGLSLIPLYFMQQYVQTLLEEQNGFSHLASQATNYVSGVVNSIQGQAEQSDQQIDLINSYLFAKNNIINAPFTLGLILLWLLVIDILKRSSFSLINYFIVAIGGVLFFLLQLVLAPYLASQLAYTIAAAIITILLTVYLSGCLKNSIETAIFGLGLVGIFALAFWLINQVDNILLYGAICLVIVFAVVILFTRKIDWREPAKRVEGKAKKLN